MTLNDSAYVTELIREVFGWRKIRVTSRFDISTLKMRWNVYFAHEYIDAFDTSPFEVTEVNPIQSKLVKDYYTGIAAQAIQVYLNHVAFVGKENDGIKFLFDRFFTNEQTFNECMSNITGFLKMENPPELDPSLLLYAKLFLFEHNLRPWINMTSREVTPEDDEKSIPPICSELPTS